MKKAEKQALKLVKKGFTLAEWNSFTEEVKMNELVVNEVVKKVSDLNIERTKVLCEQNPFLIKNLPEKVQLELVTNDNFCYLNEDLQLRIVEKNNLKVKYASEETQVKFATLNPRKISYLSEESQKKLVAKNEFFLEFASPNVQIESAQKDSKLLCRCSNMIQCMFIKNDPNYYTKCRYEVKRDIIKLSFLSPEKTTIETLESYISTHYDNLSLNELSAFKESVSRTNREDKGEMEDYISYLTVNINKKRM